MGDRIDGSWSWEDRDVGRLLHGHRDSRNAGNLAVAELS